MIILPTAASAGPLFTKAGCAFVVFAVGLHPAVQSRALLEEPQPRAVRTEETEYVKRRTAKRWRDLMGSEPPFWLDEPEPVTVDVPRIERFNRSDRPDIRRSRNIPRQAHMRRQDGQRRPPNPPRR